MIQGVIFDLDGVLIHTDALHYAAWKSIAGLLGIPFTRADNVRLLGIGRRASLDILLERYKGMPLTEKEKDALCDRKNALYRQQLSRLSPPDITPEVRRTLGTLQARGLRLAVGSSSRNARLILEKTNLLSVFDAVADGTAGGRSKPEPDIFLHAAGLLGLSPACCLVVEDAPAGIAAARAAGMTVVRLGAPDTPDGTAVPGAAADYTVGSLSELPELLP